MLMGIYISLNKEYGNETKSKRELYRILKLALSDMDIKEDLLFTIEALKQKFELESDAAKKAIIYDDLKIINNTIQIMEKVRNAR